MHHKGIRLLSKNVPSQFPLWFVYLKINRFKVTRDTLKLYVSLSVKNRANNIRIKI